MSTHFIRDKLIRFHHCDPAGIVFYPQYFVLFNELVEDWFNEGLGINFADMHTESHLGVPMGNIECRFHAPSKVGETLQLRLAVQHIGRSSIRLAVSGHGGGETRIEAKLTVVLASLQKRKSVAIPEDWRGRLGRFVEAGSTEG